jgi:two-component sensor histidine kinase
MSRRDGDARDPWVLVHAPFRKDGQYLEEFLAQHEIACAVAADGPELARLLEQDPAAVAITQEGLTRDAVSALNARLAAEPSWSDLPLVALLDAPLQTNSALAGLRRALPTEHLTVLQRPLRPPELLTSIRSAMAARSRQLEVKQHLQWQEEMQRELNHRVKNLLATVAALYRMTARQSGSLEQFQEIFDGRLVALGEVHNLLVAGQFAATPLHQIAARTLAPYRFRAAKNRVTLSGPDVKVHPSAAMTLGLCLHELATNAAKYGAFSRPEGVLELSWRLEPGGDADMLVLTWRERGVEVAPAPVEEGYGASFVRTAVRTALGGSAEWSYGAPGLTVALAFPRPSG